MDINKEIEKCIKYGRVSTLSLMIEHLISSALSAEGIHPLSVEVRYDLYGRGGSEGWFALLKLSEEEFWHPHLQRKLRRLGLLVSMWDSLTEEVEVLL